MDDESIPTCGICGRTLAREWQVVLVDDDGSQEYGWVTVEDYLLADLANGTTHVCLLCYPEKARQTLSDGDLAELHYQRGLELSLKEDRIPARECFLAALGLRRTAEYVAALATTEDSRDEADRLNREALALDPNCDIARLNLRRPREGESII